MKVFLAIVLGGLVTCGSVVGGVEYIHHENTVRTQAEYMATHETVEVSGTFSVPTGYFDGIETGQACTSPGAWNEFKSGAPVEILNGGHAVGLGELTPGVVVTASSVNPNASWYHDFACQFSFDIPGISIQDGTTVSVMSPNGYMASFAADQTVGLKEYWSVQ